MSDHPGFRLSPRDAVVLGIAAAASIWLWSVVPLAGSLVAVVVGHFFLFCNVFRVRTRLELIWASTFVANIFGSSLFDVLDWPHYLLVQIPVTVSILVLTLRHRDYHGVLWQWVNPDLRDPKGVHVQPSSASSRIR